MSDDPKFRPGDVVRLKSGEPRMTIERVDEYTDSSGHQVRCTWSDGCAATHCSFAAIQLVAVPDDAGHEWHARVQGATLASGSLVLEADQPGGE